MPGPKTVTFLFAPADELSEVPVVVIETKTSGSTYLSNAEASYVPQASNVPQSPVSMRVGEGQFMFLSPRDGSGNAVWDYESTQVAIHGALIKQTGVCTVTSEADLG